MTKHFYKSVDKSSYKSMYEFLHNHSEYYTLNSWNGPKSIAHNVKLYNLPLKHKWTDVLEAIEADCYATITDVLENFENAHNVRVAFNGHNGGYLVLYNTNNYRHIFDSSYSPVDYDKYSDWVEDVKVYYGNLKEYKSELLYQVELVQAFDKLCDELIDVCDNLTEEYISNKNATKSFKATKFSEAYNYETEEEQRLHELYMQKRGYTIHDRNTDTDVIWTEYSMEEEIEDSVIDK